MNFELDCIPRANRESGVFVLIFKLSIECILVIITSKSKVCIEVTTSKSINIINIFHAARTVITVTL